MMPRWVFPLVPPVDWDSTLFFSLSAKRGEAKELSYPCSRFRVEALSSIVIIEAFPALRAPWVVFLSFQRFHD